MGRKRDSLRATVSCGLWLCAWSQGTSSGFVRGGVLRAGLRPRPSARCLEAVNGEEERRAGVLVGGPPASDAGTVQFGGLLLPSCGEGDTLIAFVGWVGSSPAGLQKPSLSDASSLAF